MKVFRIKASCDFIEDVEVIAESKEQAEELGKKMEELGAVRLMA